MPTLRFCGAAAVLVASTLCSAWGQHFSMESRSLRIHDAPDAHGFHGVKRFRQLLKIHENRHNLPGGVILARPSPEPPRHLPDAFVSPVLSFTRNSSNPFRRPPSHKSPPPSFTPHTFRGQSPLQPPSSSHALAPSPDHLEAHAFTLDHPRGAHPTPSHASAPSPDHIEGPPATLHPPRAPHPTPSHAPAPSPEHIEGPPATLHPPRAPHPTPLHAPAPSPEHIEGPPATLHPPRAPHPTPLHAPAPSPEHIEGPPATLHPPRVPHPAPSNAPAPSPDHLEGPPATLQAPRVPHTTPSHSTDPESHPLHPPQLQDSLFHFEATKEPGSLTPPLRSPEPPRVPDPPVHLPLDLVSRLKEYPSLEESLSEAPVPATMHTFFEPSIKVQAEEVTDEEWGQYLESEWGGHGIVPDLIGAPPPYLVNVNYGDHLCVHLGTVITPAQARHQPKTLQFPGEAGRHYAILLLDLDRPPRPYVSWMLINVPHNQPQKGTEVVEYEPPHAAQHSGPHRMVFLVYLQQSAIPPGSQQLPRAKACQKSGRELADLASMTRDLGLKGPVAGNYFLAEWDITVEHSCTPPLQ